MTSNMTSSLTVISSPWGKSCPLAPWWHDDTHQWQSTEQNTKENKEGSSLHQNHQPPFPGNPRIFFLLVRHFLLSCHSCSPVPDSAEQLIWSWFCFSLTQSFVWVMFSFGFVIGFCDLIWGGGDVSLLLSKKSCKRTVQSSWQARHCFGFIDQTKPEGTVSCWLLPNDSELCNGPDSKKQNNSELVAIIQKGPIHPPGVIRKSLPSVLSDCRNEKTFLNLSLSYSRK